MDHVIDTNYLRTPANPAALTRPDLEQLLQSSAPGDRFVLTDTAIIEQLKNAQWESTSRSSFKIIARFPDKVWIAKAPGDLRRQELSTGVETGDVIDAEMSARFRILLAELASGIDGPNMAHLRATIAAAQAGLPQQQQNHTANLQGLKAAGEAIEDALKKKDYRKSSDPAQQKNARLFLIKTLAQNHLRSDVDKEGKPDALGEALAQGRGISIRYYIGFYCLGFKWAMKGTISPDAAKATNEIMDLSHALIATYFDDILSEEASVREMRTNILDVLNSNFSLADLMSPTA